VGQRHRTLVASDFRNGFVVHLLSSLPSQAFRNGNAKIL